MKLTRREIIFGCSAVVLTILLISGMNMFFSSLDEKTEDSAMVNDYLEVDKALRTKDACDEKKSADRKSVV